MITKEQTSQNNLKSEQLSHKQIAGSFRDPSGHVFSCNSKIFRTITNKAYRNYEELRDKGIFSECIKKGYLISFEEIEKSSWPIGNVSNVEYIIEHPRIPYISHPYEWSFSQLKAAALHHLNFQLDLLERNVVLSDASAYNIQFIGHKPIFIDLLSLKPYQKGEFWYGHRQFCEQFLNPLLLRSLNGICHNSWFRGTLEGIPTTDLARLIPIKKKFSWNVFSQVVLQSMLANKAVKSPDEAINKARAKRTLSKVAYRALLTQMRNWIAKLVPAGKESTVWENYACDNTYSTLEMESKRKFVEDFVRAVKPDILFDLGCNTGDYSVAAINAGAKYVVGFDFDQNTIDMAFSRSIQNDLSFLPLFLDASNPSPNQGWMQAERDGFASRAKADALIALAFEHHLAIAKNVPIHQLIKWIIEMAPKGVIEFVPKSDPTVQKMLSLREDIFDDYNIETFEKELSVFSKIIRKQVISESGRCLYWYERF